MDTTGAIGLAAAPAVVASLIAIIKPLLRRVLPADAIPPIALLIGVGYTVAAWQGGAIEAESAIVAVLLGLTVGVGAVGVRESFRRVRPE